MNTKYEDLNFNEKFIYHSVENIFIHNYVSRTRFVKILGMLIQKYKLKYE